MSETPHILIVDDDSRIRGLLKKYLSRNDYVVSEARDAAHARKLLDGLIFDLIVIDVMMPGEDGFALTKALRQTMDTPVMLLTAKGDAEDRITGLESGADDYLAKPFEPRELLLRISAILRRSSEPVAEADAPELPRTLSLGHCRYDVNRGELWHGQDPVRLTTAESALMRLLARQAGEPARLMCRSPACAAKSKRIRACRAICKPYGVPGICSRRTEAVAGGAQPLTQDVEPVPDRCVLRLAQIVRLVGRQNLSRAVLRP